jgi:hypothetical protein
MMGWRKLSIIIIAIFLSWPALAFDYNKLLSLRPLPSVRYKQIGDNAEKNKWLLTAGYGFIGGWMVINNINKGFDAYRVNNIFAGSTLLVTGALNYMVPNSYLVDQKLLSELDLKSGEKESLAYFEIKSSARSSLVTRRTTALAYFLSGLSSAIIAGSSPNLTDNERFWTNVNAIGFLGLAAYQLFWPSEVEIVADQIDNELAR